MNKKNYKKIIDKLNKRLNTDKFNFGYCGGTFYTTLGKVDVHLHKYDKMDNLYYVFIKYHKIKKAINHGILGINEHNGKSNIYSNDLNYVLNMINYYLF